MSKAVVVLFSDDFRINDNPALHQASEDYENVILLYVYDENYLGRKIGSAAKVFLYEVLKSLQALLKNEYNANLIIQKGDAVEVIKKISEEIEVDAIYFNRSYTAEQIKQEKLLRSEFVDLHIRSFKGKLLFDPWQIKTASTDDYYKVFTPFAKECLKNLHLVGNRVEKPKKIASIHNIVGIEPEALNLIPKNEGNWHAEILANWSFDYKEIERKFQQFLFTKLNEYKNDRNFPDKNANSMISAYLRFGMLGIRWCFKEVALATEEINNQFVLELLWREFAYNVMFYNQDIATEELKKNYKQFKWNNDEEFFDKWKKGETGFDIVDAGMKELWHTGIMHNRLRMIVASFLIKDLFIDWRLGEQWFWETLVDADAAINPFSWQWVFGSGLDAAPYFRIFNPDAQQERFDPEGLYCQKWLSGRQKIQRIVDHDVQKKIALERYNKVMS